MTLLASDGMEAGAGKAPSSPLAASMASAAAGEPAVHVARVSERRVVRAAWAAGGTLSLIAGLVGIVVPGWPTTIFLIVAAACYARSSQRMYDRVLRIKGFGEHVRRFRETGAMPVRAKVIALGLMWPFVAFAVLFAIPASARWASILTLALALAGTAYILSLPVADTSTSRASNEA